MLYHIELFALKKVSFFMAPQIGDSCWHRTGANNHWLTPPDKFSFIKLIFKWQARTEQEKTLDQVFLELQSSITVWFQPKEYTFTIILSHIYP